MHEYIHEKVSVVTVYNREKGIIFPKTVKWQGRIYAITKIGYHHKLRDGRKLIHIFSVCNEAIAMKLSFDTETMHWILEEVSDGFAA